jgi:hypothetical protein
MVLRWAAAASLITEKSLHKIQSYRDLWMVKATLEEQSRSTRRPVEKVA